MEMKRSIVKRMMYTALLAAALLYSCKKETLATTSEPVVQAYLMPDSIITVKLYGQKSLTDTSSYGPALTGLKLNVSDGTNTVTLTETTKGVYTYANTSFVAAGKTYTLTFSYQSVTVSATTSVPAKPQGFATQYVNVDYTPPTTFGGTPDTINTFTWQNPDSLNHVLVFDNLDGKDFPLNAFSGGSQNFEEDTKRKSVYYCLPQIFPYYGHYKVVLLSVNQEYINLLESNASGANSQNLLNVPTNVINGYGIFTAFQSDTLSFNLL
jgi:hypothetical protein